MHWQMDGLQLGIAFNDSILICPPKGDEQDDVIGQSVTRKAEDTRPLSLRNSGAKIISWALNSKLKRAVATTVCWTQRGFLTGRNFCENLVEGGAYARMARTMALEWPASHRPAAHATVALARRDGEDTDGA